jgi:hypothetical protein
MTTHVPKLEMTYDASRRIATYTDSITGRQFKLSNTTEEKARAFMTRAAEMLGNDCRDTTANAFNPTHAPPVRPS